MSLATTERKKYEAVWRGSPAYKRHSPGLRHAPEGLGWYLMHGCMSLLDFGCGDGRALEWFNAHPEVQYAHGIDIAHETPDISRLCLWEPLPETLRADFGYSCDVLEHIPPEHVPAVIENMANAVRTAAWVQIALFPDTHGTLGDWGTLHLTVKPLSWWAIMLSVHFKVVYSIERRDRATFLLTK